MTKYISLRNFTRLTKSGVTHNFNKGEFYFLKIRREPHSTYFSVFSTEKIFIVRIWLDNIDDCFITIAKWRELQIETIIND